MLRTQAGGPVRRGVVRLLTGTYDALAAAGHQYVAQPLSGPERSAAARVEHGAGLAASAAAARSTAAGSGGQP